MPDMESSSWEISLAAKVDKNAACGIGPKDSIRFMVIIQDFKCKTKTSGPWCLLSFKYINISKDSLVGYYVVFWKLI
jgi:hypothetical protein